jgi:hypothetical protein
MLSQTGEGDSSLGYIAIDSQARSRCTLTMRHIANGTPYTMVSSTGPTGTDSGGRLMVTLERAPKIICLQRFRGPI